MYTSQTLRIEGSETKTLELNRIHYADNARIGLTLQTAMRKRSAKTVHQQKIRDPHSQRLENRRTESALQIQMRKPHPDVKMTMVRANVRGELSSRTKSPRMQHKKGIGKNMYVFGQPLIMTRESYNVSQSGRDLWRGSLSGWCVFNFRAIIQEPFRFAITNISLENMFRVFSTL